MTTTLDPFDGATAAERLHLLAEKRSALGMRRIEAVKNLRVWSHRLRLIDDALDRLDATETALLMDGGGQ